MQKQHEYLKANRTRSEIRFAEMLRERGVAFKEQEPIMNYFPDFYFPDNDHRIIELDGKFHQGLKEHDRIRDARLRAAVTWWMGNGYRAQSVLKVIEYYDQLALGKPQYGVPAKPRPSQLDAGRPTPPPQPLTLVDDDFCPFCKLGTCHTHERQMEAA